MSYSNIKGIIFDLGSTLIEFESRAWNEITIEGQKLAYDLLAKNNSNLPEFDIFNDRLEEIKAEFRAHAVSTLEEWRSQVAFEKLLTELKVEKAAELSGHCMDAFYNYVREGIVTCDGAEETLRELRFRGYRIGLISNTIFPIHQHELDLDNFGLMPYIGFRIYSSEFGYRKPHPEIYREGLKRIDLPPEETLFVGDRYYEDVEGPQKAGMLAILKYRANRDYPDPMPEGFPVIEKISELLSLLKPES